MYSLLLMLLLILLYPLLLLPTTTYNSFHSTNRLMNELQYPSATDYSYARQMHWNPALMLGKKIDGIGR